jgi:hypothetical protein
MSIKNLLLTRRSKQSPAPNTAKLQPPQSLPRRLQEIHQTGFYPCVK